MIFEFDDLFIGITSGRIVDKRLYRDMGNKFIHRSKLRECFFFFLIERDTRDLILLIADIIKQLSLMIIENNTLAPCIGKSKILT